MVIHLLLLSCFYRFYEMFFVSIRKIAYVINVESLKILAPPSFITTKFLPTCLN